MKKILLLLFLSCICAFSGTSPVQQNPYTTNTAASLPAPSSVLTNNQTGPVGFFPMPGGGIYFVTNSNGGGIVVSNQSGVVAFGNLNCWANSSPQSGFDIDAYPGYRLMLQDINAQYLLEPLPYQSPKMESYGLNGIYEMGFNSTADNGPGGYCMWFNYFVDAKNRYHPGTVGVPMTTVSMYPSGCADTLSGLPTAPKDNVAAMPVPPIMLAFQAPAGPQSEITITNAVLQIYTNGITSAITNAGGSVWFDLQDPYLSNILARSRDNNQLLSLTTTNGFPDATNLINLLHGWGVKVSGQIYEYGMPTNYVSIGANGITSTNYEPAIAPNNIMGDVSTFYNWGFDGIDIADNPTSSWGTYNLFLRSLKEEMLAPAETNNFYRYSYQRFKQRTTPMALLSYHQGWDLTPTFSWSDANLINYDQTFEYPGAITSGSPVVQYMAAFRYLTSSCKYLIGPGHYTVLYTLLNGGDPGTVTNQLGLSATAMSSSVFQLDWNSYTSTLQGTYPSLAPLLTNSVWLSIYDDPGCQVAAKIFDNGSTNTSAWYKPLINGQYAVMFVNETGAATTNAATLPGPTNQFYTVYDVWNNSTIGNYAGTFTYTNVPSLGCALLKLTPATANAGGLTNFANLTVTNSASSWLVSGGTATAPSAGLVSLTMVVTNTQVVWLTNQTTHVCIPFGNLVSTWTNFDTVQMLVKKNDVIGVTNMGGSGGATLYGATFQSLQ